MDPAKVAGLATVLARAAKERQVVVLTHDTRLADAMGALDIAATVIEVVRREQSVVECVASRTRCSDTSTMLCGGDEPRRFQPRHCA